MMKIILALLALTFLALTSAKKLSILDVLRAVEDAGDGNFEIVLRRKRTVDHVPSVKPYSLDHVRHRHKRSESKTKEMKNKSNESSGDTGNNTSENNEGDIGGSVSGMT